MCTELFLAIIYFLTILVVNFFLYKLLKSYFVNIIYLVKLKNILTSFEKENLKVITLYYFLTKNEFKNQNLFLKINKFSKVKDILIIGNTYQFFFKNLSKANKDFRSINYYLKLLEKKYLPKENG
jgi:hypothetical protein